MMMPDLRQRLGGEDGSNLLEYALVVILFMTLLFGIMGMGMMLYAYHFVNSVARDASRWAAVNGSTCATDSSCSAPAQQGDVQTFVSNHTPEGIDPTQVTTTATWASTTPAFCAATENAPGCIVQVQVSYNFRWIFPASMTSPITLSSTSEMIIAH